MLGESSIPSEGEVKGDSILFYYLKTDPNTGTRTPSTHPAPGNWVGRWWVGGGRLHPGRLNKPLVCTGMPFWFATFHPNRPCPRVNPRFSKSQARGFVHPRHRHPYDKLAEKIVNRQNRSRWKKLIPSPKKSGNWQNIFS